MNGEIKPTCSCIRRRKHVRFNQQIGILTTGRYPVKLKHFQSGMRCKKIRSSETTNELLKLKNLKEFKFAVAVLLRFHNPMSGGCFWKNNCPAIRRCCDMLRLTSISVKATWLWGCTHSSFPQSPRLGIGVMEWDPRKQISKKSWLCF